MNVHDLETASDAPAPPPLPPGRPRGRDKVSKFVLKTRAAPLGWYYQDSRTGPPPDPSLPPTGAYFVYGTLMDPTMLKDVLDLTETPFLRPAKIIGYACRSWGQYPALVDGATGEEVKGFACHITERSHAQRLAEYETNNYRTRAVNIRYTDTHSPAGEPGWAFMFEGRESELDDTKFDLDVWLRRMGRVNVNPS